MFKDVTRLSLDTALAVVPFGWILSRSRTCDPQIKILLLYQSELSNQVREGFEPSIPYKGMITIEVNALSHLAI